MNQFKTKTFISILTAAIILLIPIVAMAADPPTLVPKTGQTTSYATGDDGNHQTGISSPNPRFTDNGDGTVMDKQTGLVWLKMLTALEQEFGVMLLRIVMGLTVVSVDLQMEQ